jgi:hypothetical protein
VKEAGGRELWLTFKPSRGIELRAGVGEMEKSAGKWPMEVEETKF